MTRREAVVVYGKRCRMCFRSKRRCCPRQISVVKRPAHRRLAFRASCRYALRMVKINEKYVTDRRGQRTDVVLSRKDYARLMDYLEDLEDRLEIRKRKRGAKFVAWETAKARFKTT